MKRTMYEAARHTPKRGVGSSNLLGDAINAVTARGCGIFLVHFYLEDWNVLCTFS